ncbi:MAG: hypothetical protein QXR54_01945 [Nanopusillaceae archaeon]
MMWKCEICGFIYKGENPPEKCPKCGAMREKFRKLSEEEEKLIERSQLTNSLHIQALLLLEDLLDIAEAGIEDNLDPGCYKIFQEEKNFAIEMIQKIKAELETHMKKGKFG